LVIHDALGDLLLAQQIAERVLSASVGGYRPDDFLLPEVLRHVHAEDESLSPREEVGRLAAVGSAEFDRVVWSCGNGQFCCQLRLK
jgi:hypothetical protein